MYKISSLKSCFIQWDFVFYHRITGHSIITRRGKKKEVYMNPSIILFPLMSPLTAGARFTHTHHAFIQKRRKEEKMFRSLRLTAQINCTYKTQITFFNLKMIGPGPSPGA